MLSKLFLAFLCLNGAVYHRCEQQQHPIPGMSLLNEFGARLTKDMKKSLNESVLIMSQTMVESMKTAEKNIKAPMSLSILMNFDQYGTSSVYYFILGRF